MRKIIATSNAVSGATILDGRIALIALMTGLFDILAERVRFELTVPVKARQFSRLEH